MESIARLRFKAGSTEVEYEGSASFLEGKLEATVAALMELAKGAPALTPSAEKSASEKGAQGAAELSTNTIATILDAKSCADLVIAAAARLSIVDGKLKFTRKEVIAQIKTATTFYKATYKGGNLSGALATLVKAKRLLLQGADEYALSATELKSLEAKLA